MNIQQISFVVTQERSIPELSKLLEMVQERIHELKKFQSFEEVQVEIEKSLTVGDKQNISETAKINKIAAVKMVKEKTGYGIIECKYYVDSVLLSGRYALRST
jgi:ribosomal protein L7/L12